MVLPRAAVLIRHRVRGEAARLLAGDDWAEECPGWRSSEQLEQPVALITAYAVYLSQSGMGAVNGAWVPGEFGR
jgi:hypothetical protein